MVAHGFRPDLNHTLPHIGTRVDRVPFPHMGQFRAAGNGGIVHQGLSGDNHAVHGDFLARMQHDDVPNFDRGNGHFHFHIAR